MRQIRFRFDGQPINETDTPAQVRVISYDQVILGSVQQCWKQLINKIKKYKSKLKE